MITKQFLSQNINSLKFNFIFFWWIAITSYLLILNIDMALYLNEIMPFVDRLIYDMSKPDVLKIIDSGIVQCV